MGDKTFKGLWDKVVPFNIREHCWEEFCIAEVHTKIARVNSTDYVELEFHHAVTSLMLSREDSIALAKHFGHYKEPTK